MKICVVTTVFPRWQGDGEGVFVWRQVQELAAQGLDIRVVAMHSQGAATYERMDGIPVVRPLYWWPPSHALLRKDGGGLPINLRRYRLAWLQLAPFLLRHTIATIQQAHGCDLIHAHFTLSAAVACAGQAIHRCPVVVTVHGSDILQVPKLPGGTSFTRAALRSCAHITTVSQALYQETTRLGVPATKMSVVSNGVDVTSFTPPADKPRENVILFVGSLIQRKGVHYLLQACSKLLRAAAELSLVIIGDGPELQRLQTLAQSLNIATQVKFLGFQPPEIIRQWMQRARLFVLPSTEEGQGVVLLEALACGTPVIGSRVGGIAEVIHEQVGRLVPPADVEALANAIEEVLAYPAEWTKLSSAARQLAVTHYDSRQMAQRLIQIYRTICQQ